MTSDFHQMSRNGPNYSVDRYSKSLCESPLLRNGHASNNLNPPSYSEVVPESNLIQYPSNRISATVSPVEAYPLVNRHENLSE